MGWLSITPQQREVLRELLWLQRLREVSTMSWRDCRLCQDGRLCKEHLPVPCAVCGREDRAMQGEWDGRPAHQWCEAKAANRRDDLVRLMAAIVPSLVPIHVAHGVGGSRPRTPGEVAELAREYAEAVMAAAGRLVLPALPPAVERLGMRAYNAYGDFRKWLTFKGDPMPRWEAQDEGLREGWRIAAAGVLADPEIAAKLRAANWVVTALEKYEATCPCGASLRSGRQHHPDCAVGELVALLRGERQ